MKSITYFNGNSKYKLYLLFILIVSISYGCNNSPVTPNPQPDNSDVNKRLLEMFVNTRCTVCPPADHYADNINNLAGITQNDTNVIIIRYHTTLYPGDPFYDFNPVDNLARQTLYNAGTANPRAFLMSKFLSVFNSSSWTDSINSSLSSPSNSVDIKLSNNYNVSTGIGSLVSKFKSFENISSDSLKYFVILTENNIPYNAPNGITNFNNVMRDIFTDPNGNSIILPVSVEITQTTDYTINSQIVISNSFLNVFVQDLNSKKIYGINRIKVN